MLIAIVGTGGRITVPAEVRRNLRLLPGNRVEFLKVNGEVCIRKYEPSNPSIRDDSDPQMSMDD